MKRLISVILAIVMLSTLCVMASADETGVEKGTYGTDVTGTYVEGTVGNGIVYSVDIRWSDMSFTYHSEKAPVWDVTDHTYSEAVPAYWEGSGRITVSNHSNISISVAPSYIAEEGYSDADMLFDVMALVLDSAANGNKAKTGKIDVTPSGSLPENTENQKIGSIQVTIRDSGLEEMTAEQMISRAEAMQAELSAMNHEMGSKLNSTMLTNAFSAAAVVRAFDSTADINEIRAAFIAARNAHAQVYVQYSALKG